MKFYMAPLEGITGHVFRNALYTHFNNLDKYFVPFIKPNQKGHFSSREKQDILPENNEGRVTVPQILTNSAEDFVRTAWKLKQYGYSEVNLNLGCPSKTVISKGRGAGFLAFPEELERFLDTIFSETEMDISIKTRVGKESPEEFPRILDIYNKYPLKELIIHPRVQHDFYKNKPNWDMFRYAVENSRNPLCYNGDLFTEEDYQSFTERFPDTDCLMFGRGLLMNPGLTRTLRQHILLDKETLHKFHDQLYGDYCRVLSGDRTILFKMKELWTFLGPAFTNHAKYVKKIKKAEKCRAYEEVVETLFAEQEICL